MAKIMLVEDDNNLREIYGARLAAEGHEIVAAKDGEEALAMAVKEKPDLIISDVMMPRISGFDMLDILRNAPETRDTKVIMMTALSQAEDKSRADKLGADRYLVKSQVTLEDVARVVKDVLEGNEDANLQDTSPVPTSAPTPTPAPSPVMPPAPIAPEPPAQSPPAQVTPAPAPAAPTAPSTDQPASAPPPPAPTAEPTAAATDPVSGGVPPVVLPSTVAEPPASSGPATAPPTAPAPPSDQPSSEPAQEPATATTPSEPPVATDSPIVADATAETSAPAVPAATPTAAPSDAASGSTPEESTAPAQQPPATAPNLQPAPLEVVLPAPPSEAAPPAPQEVPAPATPAAPDPDEEHHDDFVGPNLTEALAAEEVLSTTETANRNDGPSSAAPTIMNGVAQPGLITPRALATEPPRPDELKEPVVIEPPEEEAPQEQESSEVDPTNPLDDKPKKKVIRPIHKPQDGPDLNALLAAEEAKAAVINPTATSVISPDGQAAGSLPAPPQATSPGAVATPNQTVPQPAPKQDHDDHSKIAL